MIGKKTDMKKLGTLLILIGFATFALAYMGILPYTVISGVNPWTLNPITAEETLLVGDDSAVLNIDYSTGGLVFADWVESGPMTTELYVNGEKYAEYELYRTSDWSCKESGNVFDDGNSCRFFYCGINTPNAYTKLSREQWLIDSGGSTINNHCINSKTSGDMFKWCCDISHSFEIPYNEQTVKDNTMDISVRYIWSGGTVYNTDIPNPSIQTDPSAEDIDVRIKQEPEQPIKITVQENILTSSGNNTVYDSVIHTYDMEEQDSVSEARVGGIVLESGYEIIGDTNITLSGTEEKPVPILSYTFAILLVLIGLYLYIRNF